MLRGPNTANIFPILRISSRTGTDFGLPAPSRNHTLVGKTPKRVYFPPFLREFSGLGTGSPVRRAAPKWIDRDGS